MSDADTKAEAAPEIEPKMKTAQLTVKMVYDPRSPESERAAKLVVAMLDAFTGAVNELGVDGCATSSMMADILMQNMASNGHENCACRTAMNYLRRAGAEIEVDEVDEVEAPQATAAAQRKAMH